MVQQLVLKNFVDHLVKQSKPSKLPVDPFSSISVENMPRNIDRMVLSNDQQYLYDICLPISRGECYSDLALRKPGPVVHSRWLKIAGRILRLYAVTEKPSHNLIILATYVMKSDFIFSSTAGNSNRAPKKTILQDSISRTAMTILCDILGSAAKNAVQRMCSVDHEKGDYIESSRSEEDLRDKV
ncbi:hypothetical protein AVEN_7015-1 [Araneus ventricosus]|uniref:Uncharacterized protein n=1 Tax=Araneus ventricosus TaxID=182803 RepID=A0A4Y2IFI1_ARAVE|nr:hypothetical protein AVEN_7015-1 [Araneus ventricosus]